MHDFKIIVLEDDLFLARALSRIIDGLGYHSTIFNKTEEFIENKDAWDNSCLIVDLGIIEKKYGDAYSYLKVKGVTIPMIVMTASTSKTDRIRALEAGAVDYLIKPFNASELNDAIKKAIQQINDI